MNRLFEDKRSQLLNKSKSADNYSVDNQAKGKNRYQRRVHSKVQKSVNELNSIDMNKLFKNGILDVNLKVTGETDDYVVSISFSNFLNDLHNQITKANADKIELRFIIRALLTAFNHNDVYVHCSCLHPDTLIKLLDGTCPTVSEMYDRFNKGEKLYVYSVDEDGDFKPGVVEKVWVTTTASKFIRITLDNNKSIVTTPEHLYMLRDGTYTQAYNLTVGQFLMPLYFNHKIIAIEYLTLEDTPVYDIKVKDFHNFLVEPGVILHNCPDFKYRFAYWLTLNDVNYIKGEQPSNGKEIANPNDTKGRGCKHILLVLSNTSWLTRLSSVIYNYINYMEKHYQQMYADVIYPAIYEREYEEPVQLDMFSDGELDTDSDTIDTSNKWARTKSQFKPGNDYRFTKSETIPGQISIDDQEIS